jgi:hypothetical protein
MSERDEPLPPDEPPGPRDEGERLAEDVGELPAEADRDDDEAPGISGPEHLGLTPPG